MEQSTPQREFEFGIETNDLEKIQKLFAVIPRNSQLRAISRAIENKKDALKIVEFLLIKTNPDQFEINSILQAANLVKSQDLEMLKLIIKHGANVNLETFITSVNVGNFEFVQFLCQSFPTIATPNENLMKIMAKNGQIELFKSFTINNNDPNKTKSVFEECLEVAIQSNQFELVKFLCLEKLQQELGTPQKAGKFAFICCENGKLEMLKFFIEKFNAPLDYLCVEKKQNTCLIAACSSGNLELVKFLTLPKENNNNTFSKFRNFLKEQDVDKSNVEDQSPSFIAAEFGNLDILKFLVLEKGAKFKKQSKIGQSPLSIASAKNHLEIVKFLVNKGADFKDLEQSGSPTYLAASNGSLDVLKFLISKGIDINKLEGKPKQTPLIIASKNNQIEAVKCLLENNADPNKQNEYGHTALYVACLAKSLECVKLLIEHGANPNVKTQGGTHVFWMLAEEGTLPIIQLLVESKKVDLNQIFEQGQNALFAAVMSEKVDVVNYLISKGIEKNKQNEKQETCLFIAARQYNEKIIDCLVGYGADLEIPNKMDQTPIIIATERGNLNIVKILGESGANVNKVDSFGQSPIRIAIRALSSDLVSYLIKKGAQVSDWSVFGSDGIWFKERLEKDGLL